MVSHTITNDKSVAVLTLCIAVHSVVTFRNRPCDSLNLALLAGDSHAEVVDIPVVVAVADSVVLFHISYRFAVTKVSKKFEKNK